MYLIYHDQNAQVSPSICKRRLIAIERCDGFPYPKRDLRRMFHLTQPHEVPTLF